MVDDVLSVYRFPCSFEPQKNKKPGETLLENENNEKLTRTTLDRI